METIERKGPTEIFVVIHCLNTPSALNEARVAIECGADGVFLISHRGEDMQAAAAATVIKRQNMDFSVGINLLATSPKIAFDIASTCGLDMVWADYMGVNSSGGDRLAEEMSQLAKSYPNEIRLFASVAFKYQMPEENPPLAAANARSFGFIPTTSGPATGSAPELAKIIAMSKASEGDLAVASGMTPENVVEFAPYLRAILVATGVCRDEFHIDPTKLKALVNNCRLSERQPKEG